MPVAVLGGIVGHKEPRFFLPAYGVIMALENQPCKAVVKGRTRKQGGGAQRYGLNLLAALISVLYVLVMAVGHHGCEVWEAGVRGLETSNTTFFVNTYPPVGWIFGGDGRRVEWGREGGKGRVVEGRFREGGERVCWWNLNFDDGVSWGLWEYEV